MGGVVSYIVYVTNEIAQMDPRYIQPRFILDDYRRVDHFINGALIGGYFGLVTSVFVFPAIKRLNKWY
jgi:hypothetical protein